MAAYTSGDKPHYEYGRYGSPTREAAERKLAVLEGGDELSEAVAARRAAREGMERGDDAWSSMSCARAQKR